MSRGSKHTGREDILAAIRKLFTGSGYQNVTMRDIAAELGISVGNLTYYYRNKNQLIEAAIIDKHHRAPMISAAATLAELDGLLEACQAMQKEHLYYFRHYSQLSVFSEKVMTIQQQVYCESRKTWHDTLENLQQEGLLTPEAYDGQFDTLITTILFLSAYWFEQDNLNQQVGRETPDFRQSVWGMLFPLLTAEGKDRYFREVHHG